MTIAPSSAKMAAVIVLVAAVLAAVLAILVVALDLRRLVARSLADHGEEVGVHRVYPQHVDEVEEVNVLDDGDEELHLEDAVLADEYAEEVERPRSSTPNLDRLRAEGWTR